MKRILITGAAGFLGSHLCDRFIKEGYFVIGMDNLITGDLKNIEHLFDFENFEFYHQPDDEFELMNTAHITSIVNKTIPVLEKMMNAPTKEIKLNEK